jgi:hypothetical protein
MVSGESTVQVADPFLVRLIEELDAIVIDARSLTDGLTEKQFNWKPRARRWSIAQCLEHVTLTAALYPPEIERMIGEARARSAANERAYREGWLSRWVISGMEPPPKFRIRTRRKVDPASDLDRATVMRNFEAVHGRLRDLTASADGVSLRHGRMRSPFAPILHFTLGQVLALNPAHARRHLWQARQVLQHPDFPA